MNSSPAPRAKAWHLVAGVVAPLAITGLLVLTQVGNSRDYVFLYLGVVAVLALAGGVRSAFIAAIISFFLVDFFFVRPVHSLDFADGTDVINLLVFLGAATIVGTLASRRRGAQLRAEGLADELRSANVELARLADAEHQVRVLEETDRMRREVLANVSHELRTPLASILTETTNLQRKAGLATDLQTDLESITSEARRLDRLVSELIDMTRIEGGIVEIRADRLDPLEAVEAAVQRLHRESPTRRIKIQSADQVPEILADWNRLAQILDNLLENADAAAPPQTTITTELSPSDAGLVIRIRDQGPGVPLALRATIFDRFVRGEHADAVKPGLGLGLPIARGLVEAQSGRIWLDDATEVGACFAFVLPLASSEENDNG